MDQITQNINQSINDYIQGLISECLQAPGFINLSFEQKNQIANQIREHFYQAVMETLVERLNEQQFSQIEQLDPNSPEMAEKIQLLAAQVPGLAADMENRLRQDVEYIKQNSRLPQ